MELTQEYFDKGIGSLLEKISDMKAEMSTKEDLKKLEQSLRLDLASKDDLKTQLEAQANGLKQYIHEAFETQQVWIDERFGELIVKYDVRVRVEKLEKDFKDFKQKKQAHA